MVYTTIVDPKGWLRAKSPSAYKVAVNIRRGPKMQRMTQFPGRVRGRRLFAAENKLTVDIGGKMGIGGILTNAGNALYAARLWDVELALCFSSPTYSPSWGEADWLESYFIRLGPRPSDNPICQVQHVPFPNRLPKLSECADLVWRTIRISDPIVSEANAFRTPDQFAAVHFRGSDKFLDAPPVAADAALRIVEREMERDGLTRLFVASDEPSFLAESARRFGDTCFSIPLQAMATSDGTPAHFTGVDGETKAREALITMILLSRSQLLVKTESLLSDWATTIASDQRVVSVKP